MKYSKVSFVVMAAFALNSSNVFMAEVDSIVSVTPQIDLEINKLSRSIKLDDEASKIALRSLERQVDRLIELMSTVPDACCREKENNIGVILKQFMDLEIKIEQNLELMRRLKGRRFEIMKTHEWSTRFDSQYQSKKGV